jgi:hypothetical protein
MQSKLSIQDLSVKQDLDPAAMSAVRGGNAIAIVGGNSAQVQGGGTFSPTTVAQVGPFVTNTDASTHLKLDLPQAYNVGGKQWAF